MRLLVALLALLPWVGPGAAAQEPLLTLAELWKGAAAEHWGERWAAVTAISRSSDSKAIRLALLQEGEPKVREAIAWACLLEPDLGDATLLGLVLRRDKDAAVRRAAARALVHHRDRRAVSALVEALGHEKDRRTQLHIIETLRALTPSPCLLDPEAWRLWWKEHEADPRFHPADGTGESGSYEGVVLETRTVAALPRKGHEGGPPLDLFVLPEFGWSCTRYGPNLLPCREWARLTWVGLPTVQQLTGRSGFGQDLPVYPVDLLARALDRFRESHSIPKVVILAEGASGWFAMRYAQLFPERCAALLLVDTALDKQAYVEALRRGSARGEAGEKWTARTLLHENSVPLNETTLDRMQALGLERAFYDRADLEIADLYFRARQPEGFATVPEIAWGKRTTLDLPALFLYSGASVFSGHGEMMRIGKHFPRSLVAPLNEARGLPYVESNDAFHEVVRAFLAKYRLD